MRPSLLPQVFPSRTQNRCGFVVEKWPGTDWGEALRLAIDKDSKILVAGTMDYGSFNPAAPSPGGVLFRGSQFLPCLRRYNPDGSPDWSFGNGGLVRIVSFDIAVHGGGDSEISGVACLPNGKYQVSFWLYLSDTQAMYDCVAQFNNDGTLDSSFGAFGVTKVSKLGGYYGVATGLVRDPVSGNIYTISGDPKVAGSFEAVVNGFYPTGAQLQNSSGPVRYRGVAGAPNSMRLNNGAVQADGKIIVCGDYDISGVGTNAGFCVGRLNTDMTIDSSFGTGEIPGYALINFPQHAFAFCEVVLIDPVSGKIVCLGPADYDGSGHYTIGLCRLNTNGTLDTSFGTAGYAYGQRSGYQLNDDGPSDGAFWDGDKIVTVGTSLSPGSSYYTATQQVIVARFNNNGSPDTTLNGTGYVRITMQTQSGNEVAYSCRRDPQGGYVGCGHVSGNVAGGALGSLFRVKADGRVDKSFGQPRGFSWRAKPDVTTQAVSGIAATSATANAVVNPNGYPTLCSFEYGLVSGQYNCQTEPVLVGSDRVPRSVAVPLLNLLPGLTYYVRARAYSKQGSSAFGASEVSFTTTSGNATVLYDSFSGVDGAKVVGPHLPDLKLVSGLWSCTDLAVVAGFYPDLLVLAGNKMTAASNVLAVPMASISVDRDNNYKLSAVFRLGATTSDYDIALLAQMKSFADTWYCELFGGNFHLVHRVAASNIIDLSTPFTVRVGADIRIELALSGSTITATVNGGPALSSNTLTSPGSDYFRSGCWCVSGGGMLNNTVDDFTVVATS